MPIKSDEQILNEYLPKIKAFTDERLTAENAERIYNFFKPYHYDTSGWLLYRAAQDILQTDVYSEFPAEDNLGLFETLDGDGLIKWLEIAKFADKEYEQLKGGYELLRSHTLNADSPEYQDYKKALYPAAVRAIIDNLAQKQPYLLEGFFSRLAYMENIFDKGWPTRDDLNDKIDREARSLTDEGDEAVAGRALSANLEKMNFRNILYNMPMSGEMIEALYIKGGVLDELYEQSFEAGEIGDYYDFVCDYAAKAEHDYVAERVYDRAKLEYEDYVDEVKKWTPDKIIDEAYKLTMLYDLHASLDPYCSDFSTERLMALKSLDSPLWSLYNEWQRRDFTHMDDIKDVIWDVADEQAKINEEQSFEDEDELEDGQEP